MDIFDEASSIVSKLELPYQAALNLAYLRHRSRWSLQLENRLITAARAGYIVNCDGQESRILKELGF